MPQLSCCYKGLRVLVVGLGLSGISAAQFLLKRGAHVVATDNNELLLKSDKRIQDLRCAGLSTLLGSDKCDIKQFDLVVVSPGIPHSHPYYQQALSSQVEVIGEIELACRSISQKSLAITGTNGKTTVTLLVTHVLNAAGKKAKALGNIEFGIPLTSALDQEGTNASDTFVIELSSFQLETLKHRFLDAGIILNITPDHLDRYRSMEDYAHAKIHLKDCLKPSGKLFVEQRCLKEFGSLFDGFKTYSYGYSKDCFLYSDTRRIFLENRESFALPKELQGKFSHDIENIMAAYALCREMGISPQEFLSGLHTFKKPSHRIEFIRTIAGVHFYDDSKGTNIDAVIRAVDILEGKIVLIAGGVDKGFPYTPWIGPMKDKVKKICAIGKAANKIKNDLGQHIPVELFSTLEDAVTHAASITQIGDSVLLSPGCSSYDMFKDYAHRGEEFQRIVNKL